MTDGLEMETDCRACAGPRAELLENLKSNIMDPNGFRSFVAVALKSGNEVLGVLYVFYRVPHHPDEEDLTTLGIFADRAAIRLQVSKAAEAQKKENDAERIAVVSSVAALFAHRLSERRRDGTLDS